MLSAKGWFLIFLMLAVSGCATKNDAFKIEFTGNVHNDDKYEGNYVPKDLNDCYAELTKLLSPEKVEAFKITPLNELAGSYHMGLGMSLRNSWGLWAGSRLSDYFNKMGCFHPDDMSGLILDGYWHYLNGMPFDVMKEVIEYEKYWFNNMKQEDKLCNQCKKPLHIEKTKVMKYEDGSPYVMHLLLCEKGHRWILLNGISLFEAQGAAVKEF